jgi:hypothetical protein
MNVLTTTWRQLVRLRLWPVAVLLVAALAAVPVLLNRQAEPVAEPPVPAAAAGDSAKVSETLATPVVAQATTADRSRRRRVLGVRKDPFQPAPIKKPKKAKTTKAKAKAQPKPSTSTPAPSTSSPAPSAPVVVTPAVPPKKKKTYVKGSLIVRFGNATGDTLERINLQKLAPLPDDENPLLVYTGLTKHGDKAKFLVDASLDVTGDGDCRPHPSNCETIELAVGETEFFDYVDPETGQVSAQYELDLVAIK